jgi:response regulator RpfG family c-di-GMP phosphodiesterase
VLGRASAREELEAAATTALTEHGEGFSITAACGVVVIPDEAREVSDAMRIADQRMYARKLGGRPGPTRQSKDVLVRVLAERHPDLGHHLEGVAELAEAVAVKLGLDEQEAAAVRHAASLHDIGKVAIPDSILSKPGALDEDEWVFSCAATRSSASASSAARPRSRRSAASYARATSGWTEAGYPDGLAGEDIPLGARNHRRLRRVRRDARRPPVQPRAHAR